MWRSVKKPVHGGLSMVFVAAVCILIIECFAIKTHLPLTSINLHLFSSFHRSFPHNMTEDKCGKGCHACGWTLDLQNRCHYHSHVKLFYGAGNQGIWLIGL